MADTAVRESAPYCDSKGALVAMTQHIALRLTHKGLRIRESCVYTGTVWIPIAQRARRPRGVTLRVQNSPMTAWLSIQTWSTLSPHHGYR